MASLQDQFLKAGIVDKKRIKKVKQEKHKQAKKRLKMPKGTVQVDLNKQQVKEIQADRQANDKAMNKAKQQIADNKAVQAQIIQLVKAHSIDCRDGKISYQFTDVNIIQKIYVTELIQRQLSNGTLAIAKSETTYQIIPKVIAEKISQRDESIIILLNDNSRVDVDEDDPYADYQIPDDLMW